MTHFTGGGESTGIPLLLFLYLTPAIRIPLRCILIVKEFIISGIF